MKNKQLLRIAITLLAGIGILVYSKEDINVFNIVIMVAGMIFSYLYFPVLIEKDKREKICSLIFGFLYSSVLVIGKAIYNNHGLLPLYNPRINILCTLVSAIGQTILITLIFILIINVTNRINNVNINKKPINNKHLFVLLTIIIYGAYLTALLALYPGVFSYDMMHVNRQALGVLPYDRFQPPLFSFIWSLFVKIASCTSLEASTIYALTQMIFVALFFSYLLLFIRKRNYKIYLISTLFVVFNPVFAIFSIIPVKDVPFAISFGVSILLIYEILENKTHKKNLIKLVIFILISSLLRNNAIYVYVVFFIIVFTLKKKILSKILICAIILFYLINGPLMNILGVEKGYSRESLSVPIQQISLVVYRNGDNLDEVLKEKISHFFYDYDSLTSLYNPRFADDVKELFYSDYYNEHKNEFWNLYFKLLLKYPNEFIVSFLDLNIPLWYQDAESVDPYANRDYIEINIFENMFNRDSKLYTLKNYYESVASFKLFENVPNLINIFALSFPIWFVLLTLFISIFKKTYKNIIILLPLILLWMTYLLGPVSNLRYMLPIVMLYPLLLYMCFYKDII